MKFSEIRESVFRLKTAKDQLIAELEENGGEVTESVVSQEQMIDDIKNLITNGGIDALGRLTKSVQNDIQTYKDEKAYIDRQQKRAESFLALLLELTDLVLKECDLEKVKGNLGYSYTSHTSVTTKVDTKMLKELFHEKAEKALRESGVIPDDVTISLSASSSLLPEGATKPMWYNTTSVGKATFRKPKKDDSENEFEINEF